MQELEVRQLLESFAKTGPASVGGLAKFANTLHPANAGVALGIWRKGGAHHAIAARVTNPGPAAQAFLQALRRQYPVHEHYVGRLVGPRPISVSGATPLQRKQNVLCPGLSVGHPQVTAGTLGAFVKKPNDRGLYVLSNNHVLANVNTTATPNRSAQGDAMLQPGRIDHGTFPIDAVGQLDDFHRMSLFGETMDAAIAVLHGGLEYEAKYAGVHVYGFASVQQGQRVWKIGRTTARTVGIVGSTHVRFANVGYDNAGVTVQFDHQIEVFGEDKPFSDGGDSGSLVLDEHNRAVGLLFAGTPPQDSPPLGYTLMTPIATVLQRFGVELA